MSVDQTQVLRVFDATDPDCAPYRRWPPLMDWIREHGADPRAVRRIEVLLLDAPFVRFHEVDLDACGWPQVKPRTRDEILMRPPRDVLCRRMPPERDRP